MTTSLQVACSPTAVTLEKARGDQAEKDRAPAFRFANAILNVHLANAILAVRPANAKQGAEKAARASGADGCVSANIKF
jgi:hypothetical protein